MIAARTHMLEVRDGSHVNFWQKFSVLTLCCKHKGNGALYCRCECKHVKHESIAFSVVPIHIVIKRKVS